MSLTIKLGFLCIKCRDAYWKGSSRTPGTVLQQLENNKNVKRKWEWQSGRVSEWQGMAARRRRIRKKASAHTCACLLWCLECLSQRLNGVYGCTLLHKREQSSKTFDTLQNLRRHSPTHPPNTTHPAQQLCFRSVSLAQLQCKLFMFYVEIMLMQAQLKPLCQKTLSETYFHIYLSVLTGLDLA